MTPTQFLTAVPSESDPRRRVPPSPERINLLKPGDIVQSWDPWFVWDEYCETNETRKEWRHIGDPLCDAALEELSSFRPHLHGMDLLRELQQHEKSDGPISNFLASNSELPPPGIRASPQEIQHAQDFFATHAIPITLSLLYFSLAGGFASPRISRVLRSTSYLVPANGATSFPDQASKDRTQARLLETLQFVIDIMGGSIPPTASDLTDWRGVSCLTPGRGEGWKSCMRVRLLHGVARRRVLHRSATSGLGCPGMQQQQQLFYDSTVDGVPVNQEDLAQTLSAFSFAPLHSLRRMGYSFTQADADATTAFWRHVGYYMGVDQQILKKHFASWERAEIFGATCGQILVLEIAESAALAAEMGVAPPEAPTIPILDSIDSGPDGKPQVSLEFRLAMCRFLLGEKASGLLNLPPTTLSMYVRLRLTMLSIALPVYFGTAYAAVVPGRGRNWELGRGKLMVEAICRMTRGKLGMRRTAFRPRDAGGEVKEDVIKAEELQRDPKGMEAFRKAWKSLWVEMVLVLATPGLLSVWIMWRTMRLVGGYL